MEVQAMSWSSLEALRPFDEATWNATTIEPFGDYKIVCTSMFC